MIKYDIWTDDFSHNSNFVMLKRFLGKIMKIVFILTNCAKKCTTQLHVLYGPVNEVVFYRLRKITHEGDFNRNCLFKTQGRGWGVASKTAAIFP